MIREKKIRSGPLLEADFYPVWRNGVRVPTRAPKTKPSTQEQIKYNQRQAEKKLIRLVNATRSHPMIVQGASPRASLALTAMSKATALAVGRDYVNPEDVAAVFADVITHRLILSPRAQAEGGFHPAAEILRQVPAPTVR